MIRTQGRESQELGPDPSSAASAEGSSLNMSLFLCDTGTAALPRPARWNETAERRQSIQHVGHGC